MVIGGFKNSQNAAYIMLVNRDYTAGKTATITVSDSVDGLIEVSKSTGKELPELLKDSKDAISLTFTAGEGRLFRISDHSAIGIFGTEAANNIPSIEVETSPFHSTVNIHCILPPNCHGLYRIFNMQGKTLYAAELSSGSRGLHKTLVWNGIDPEGRRPLPGLFVGSLKIAQGKSLSHKFLISK